MEERPIPLCHALLTRLECASAHRARNAKSHPQWRGHSTTSVQHVPFSLWTATQSWKLNAPSMRAHTSDAWLHFAFWPVGRREPRPLWHGMVMGGHQSTRARILADWVHTSPIGVAH